MAKPKNIDLTADGVITQEALLAYAEGRLSDADRTKMDRLLQADPFAQDALDGMRQSTSPASIPTAIISLNTQLREKTGIRERKKKGIEIHWSNYAYAAVVLGVLVGVGFVIIQVLSNNRKDDLAMNKPSPKAEESVPLAQDMKKEEAKPDSTGSDTIKSAEKPAILADSIPAKGTVINAFTASNTNTVTLSATSSGAADNKYKNESHDMVADKSVVNTTMTSETAAQLAVARAYFEGADFVNAEKKYYEILASQPDNADALYFGGISSYMNGTRDLGEANFNRLAKSSLYTDGTKWYRANIMIKKGKKEEAKQLLRDLAASNSYFKERAVKRYEELYGK